MKNMLIQLQLKMYQGSWRLSLAFNLLEKQHLSLSHCTTSSAYPKYARTQIYNFQKKTHPNYQKQAQNILFSRLLKQKKRIRQNLIQESLLSSPNYSPRRFQNQLLNNNKNMIIFMNRLALYIVSSRLMFRMRRNIYMDSFLDMVPPHLKH